MKKICFLVNHFENSNGVTKAAIDIANALAQDEALEVTLVSLFRYDKEMEKAVSPKVKLRKMFGFYFRGFTKVVDFIPKKLLYKWAFPCEYDVEVGFCYYLPTEIVAASTNKKARHYAWMHGYDNGLTIRDAYNACDKVVCVSKANADRLVRELKGSTEIAYCYNLLNETLIEQKAQETIDYERNSNPVFVTVGRLSPEKGYLRLVECAGRLKREGYDFSLWIIGDGPQKELLMEKARSLQLTDTVRFIGAQRNPHKFTSKADVFVCSSYSEGYSTACTEAVLLGIPVVTTDVSGASEIIGDAQCGMIVANEDEGLYAGMKQILDDPKLIDQWKRALKDTKARFAYSTRIQRLYEVLGLA